MIRPLEVKGLRIGEGRTKVIVPIVAPTREGIVKKALEIASLPVDMVEWRADFYEDLMDTDALLGTIKALREMLPKMPLLFTIRTSAEGGEVSITDDAYTRINENVAKTGLIDFIDVQMFLPEATVQKNIAAVQSADTLVIGSNHDFHGTPERNELVRRFRRMQELNADILKIAVMPKCTGDVLELLGATAEAAETFADRPIISMSMSSKGVISRLSGEVFGSSMTFGMVGQASAPGQIPVDALCQVLDVLHSAL